MTNLWAEASRDHDAEVDAQQRMAAKVAVSGYWPLLAQASSEREFDHRLAVVRDKMVEAMRQAQVTSARFHEETLAGVREDFRLLASTRKDASERGASATCPVCYRENVALRNGKLVTHQDTTREGNPQCDGTGRTASRKQAVKVVHTSPSGQFRVVDMEGSPIAPPFKVEQDWGGGSWGFNSFAPDLEAAKEIADRSEGERWDASRRASRKQASEPGTGWDAIDEAGLHAGPEHCTQGNPACNWGWTDKDGQQVYRCSVHGTEQVKSHTTEGSTRKTASVLRWEEGGSGPAPASGYTAIEKAMVGPRTLAQYGETHDGGGYYTLTGRETGYFGGFASPAEAKAAVESIYGAGEGLLASRKKADRTPIHFPDMSDSSRRVPVPGGGSLEMRIYFEDSVFEPDTPWFWDVQSDSAGGVLSSGWAATEAEAVAAAEAATQEAMTTLSSLQGYFVQGGVLDKIKDRIRPKKTPAPTSTYDMMDSIIEDDDRDAEDARRNPNPRQVTDQEKDEAWNALDDLDSGKKRTSSRKTAFHVRCPECQWHGDDGGVFGDRCPRCGFDGLEDAEGDKKYLQENSWKYTSSRRKTATMACPQCSGIAVASAGKVECMDCGYEGGR